MTVRRDLIGLGLVAALLFIPWLGARDLWNPNEPLYGQAVAEMAASGEWLVPTVNGAPFDEKPILYFWRRIPYPPFRSGRFAFSRALLETNPISGPSAKPLGTEGLR